MRRVIVGVLAVLLLLGAVVGVGGMAYRMGVAQGAGVAALAPRSDGAPALPDGRGPGYGYPGMPAYGWRYGGHGMMGFGPWSGGMGVLGMVGRGIAGLAVLALVFVILRMIFFRSLHWGWRGDRPWMRHEHGPMGGPPPWIEEWHRKMHEGPSSTAPDAGTKPPTSS